MNNNDGFTPMVVEKDAEVFSIRAEGAKRYGMRWHENKPAHKLYRQEVLDKREKERLAQIERNRINHPIIASLKNSNKK